MDIFLYLPLKNACSRGLVEASGFEDMGCIDPIVLTASHYMFFQVDTELVLVHRYLLEKKHQRLEIWLLGLQ